MVLLRRSAQVWAIQIYTRKRRTKPYNIQSRICKDKMLVTYDERPLPLSMKMTKVCLRILCELKVRALRSDLFGISSITSTCLHWGEKVWSADWVERTYFISQVCLRFTTALAFVREYRASLPLSLWHHEISRVVKWQRKTSSTSIFKPKWIFQKF